MKRLSTEIAQVKRKLINKAKVKGMYENFGKLEIRKLKDKYSYSDLVYGSQRERRLAGELDSFENWAMSYCG